MKKWSVSFLIKSLQTQNMQSPCSLSIFLNEWTIKCSYFNNLFVLSYHFTVFLYIIHIWCYPLISHNESTWDKYHFNIVPKTSLYTNLLSISSSYECILSGIYFHFIAFIGCKCLLLSLDVNDHENTNILYCQLYTVCFHLCFFFSGYKWSNGFIEKILFIPSYLKQ